MSANRITTVLDHTGAPFELPAELPQQALNGHAPRFAFTALDDHAVRLNSISNLTSYLANLSSSEASSGERSKRPFENHAWVFAAAFAIATSAAQAPFAIFRETDTESERRRAVAVKRYGSRWKPPRGAARQAVTRHLRVPSTKRVRMKGLEPDLDHPMMSVFGRPNPYMSGLDLHMMTHLWMAVRGEVFWLKTDMDERPVGREQMPQQLWPLSPDCFEPIFEHGSYGPLTGWWMSPPPYLSSTGARIRMPVSTSEVVQFKYPNPMDPIRGMSRLTAAAITIQSDLLARTHSRSLLRNGGRYGGIMTHPDYVDAEEEKRLERSLKEQYGGEHNSGRTKVLTGGWTWHPVSMSLVDLQILQSMDWNRQEILAAMGVPESVLGVSDAQTYATQLGQDRNFLEKTILPLFNIEESAIDAGVFHMEDDSVMGAYDLRDVESLRAGIDEKIQMAERLTSEKLHMPPRVAFDVVGLEVDEYPLDDEVLVNGLSAIPLSELGKLTEPDPEPEPEPEPTDDDEEETDEEAPDEDTDEGDPETESVAAALASAQFPSVTIAVARKYGAAWKLTPSVRRAIARGYRKKNARVRRWRQFVELEVKSESAMRRAYRKWALAERKATLERFDAAAAAQENARLRDVRTKIIDASAFLPNIEVSRNGLRSLSRPIYTASLETIYDFTVQGDLAGIAVFEIDDPAFLTFFETRQRVFTERVSETVFRNLAKTFDEALTNGETVQQMRARIAQVYDIAAGHHKTLTVARTETAGFMNGARHQMFEQGGFPGKDWVDASDEHVRVDHVIFGQAGPKPRDFDYMTIAASGGSGRLLHPNDPDGDASQVINCRCLELPATEDELS